MVAVSGSVTYYANPNVSVSSVEVDLTGPQSQTVRTSADGFYGASEIPAGTWSVAPVKLGSLGSAVSALDAARVLQVIAGLTTFSPMQRLACDVTGDGTLSAVDATRILQYSAGIITKLPAGNLCNSDWLFYPSPDSMQNQELIPPTLGGGSCNPGNIVIDPLLVQATNQDFDAILLGDCTGNWTPSEGGGAFRQRASFSTAVHAGRPRRGPGGRVRLPIYVQSRGPFQALDVTLTYDPDALSLRSARPRGAAAGAMIGVSDDEPGVVQISLASGTPIEGNGAVVVVELSGAGTAHIELAEAEVDERPARAVTHGPR